MLSCGIQKFILNQSFVQKTTNKNESVGGEGLPLRSETILVESKNVFLMLRLMDSLISRACL